VPLKAPDHDSGWLLQLITVLPGAQQDEWHTVLQLNTKSGETVFRSSSVDYNQDNHTILLKHLSPWSWIGYFLGRDSKLYSYCSLFGNEVVHSEWLIPVRIVRYFKSLCEQDLDTLTKEGYVRLGDAKPLALGYKGKLSIEIECSDPWAVPSGKKAYKQDAKPVWDCKWNEVHHEYFHLSDESGEANTLNF
jgi:hypothetical protein